MAYTRRVKEAAISMMLPPNNQSLSQIQERTRIPESTLKKWREEVRRSGKAAPSGETETEEWSSRDKFLIVVETLTKTETELAEFCRKKGLFPEQVKSWQEVCIAANGGTSASLAEMSKHEKEIERELRQVRKELQRKESALAETAALLVLRGKAAAIWGTEDEEV
jgi:transposase-like protein